MANWKNRIDVATEWKAAKSDETGEGWRKVAYAAARRIRRLKIEGRQIARLIGALVVTADDAESTADDFDEVWSDLYAWGDADHRLWIGIH